MSKRSDKEEPQSTSAVSSKTDTVEPDQATTEQTAKVEDSTPEQVKIVAKAYNKKRSCKIIVDSSSDFAPEVIRRLGVEVIPYHYVGPEGEKIDDLWESADPHEFYEFMRKNPDVRFTTMAIAPGVYFEIFENALKDGLPLLYLAFLRGFLLRSTLLVKLQIWLRKPILAQRYISSITNATLLLGNYC